MKKNILLINPPVVKPCEPPAGIAKLQGFLKNYNVKTIILDASLEGLIYLFDMKPHFSDTWTKRAYRNLSRNTSSLRNFRGYSNFDRYKRAAGDLNRLLKKAGESNGLNLTLSNYEDKNFSSLKSKDLLKAAEKPEINIFYPYFSKRFVGILEKEDFKYVGLSLNYLSQSLCTFSIAGFLRQNFPSIKIILGGGLLTSWMRRDGWKNPFKGLIDYLIDGPGEYELLKILGKEVTGKEHFSPDYSGFSLKSYFSPGLILPYSASSGCYWSKCRFCPEKGEKNPYNPISPHRVLEDLQKMTEELKPVLIHFLDNAMSPKLLRRLGEFPLNIPWYGFTRFTEDLTDLDFCRKTKKIRLYYVKARP